MGGHPVGGVVSLIAINVLVLAAITLIRGWRMGVVLALFWPFFDASRYAFNPFLIVPLALAMGLMLERGKKLLGLVMVVVAANAHLFGAAVLAGVWIVTSPVRKLGWTGYCGLVAMGSVAGYFFSPVWREWYAAFVWPVLAVAGWLIVEKFVSGRKKTIVLLLVVTAELGWGIPRYLDVWQNHDSGVLANQMSVVNWIYAQNPNSGLYVYNFTDRFYDYPYQYLFAWHGKKKYGGVPCEYSNFPGSDKLLYIPGWAKYAEPKVGCSGDVRYLIVESASNGEKNSNWIEDFRGTTQLIELKSFGKTQVEKRQVTPLFKDRYFVDTLMREYRDNALVVALPQRWKVTRSDYEEFEFENSDGSFEGKITAVGKNCETFFSLNQNEKVESMVGQINDYVLVIKRTGFMIRADDLAREISSSVRLIDDDTSKPVTRCLLQR